MALSVAVPPVYPTPGAHPSQDQPPGTDPISGDRIAMRFDQLERRQDVAECHSDDAAQQLQLLLQWAWQCDEAERALTNNDDPFMDRRPAGDSPGDQIPTGRTRVMSKLTRRV